MSKLDLSDPKVQSAINEVIDAQPDEKNTPWVLLTHIGQTPKLKVQETGDAFDEFLDELNDGKIMYGLLKVNLNGVYKGVYISWCPDGIDGIVKGKFGMWNKDMEFALKGKYHTQVAARNEDDIDLDEIKKKLKVATGSSYTQTSNVKNLSLNQAKNNIAKQQSEHLSGANVSRIDSGYQSDALKQQSAQFWSQQQKEDEEKKKQQETRTKPLPSTDLKQKSAQFWSQQQKEEEDKKKETSQPKTVTSDLKQKSAEFWSQQQRDEEDKKQESNRPTTSIKADVSGLRSKFLEQAKVSEEQKTYVPPPRQSVQAKFQQQQPEPEPVRELPKPVFQRQAEPEPEPEPEPVQEEVQEQEEQHYEPEPVQQEEQHYEPEPVQEEVYHHEEVHQEPEPEPEPEPEQEQYPKYKAMYDFDATDPEELTFAEGDILIVLKSEGDWWTAAHVNNPNTTGFIPANYIEPL